MATVNTDSTASPNEIRNPIKCTYDKCFQRFASVEAMTKHKVAASKKNPGDDIHDFYCKKCDENCEDDNEYFIHQLTAPASKHIVCPVCGQEFKSTGGRDRHVGINHRHKQRLSCRGCNMIFTDAAGMMGHIERNECKVIKRDDFYRHRAEQQIEKDALKELEGGAYHGATAIGSESSQSAPGGVTLLDDQRVYYDQDDSILRAEQYSGNGTSGLSRGMADLTIDKYPALRATSANTSTAPRRQVERDAKDDWSRDGDLLNIREEPRITPGLNESVLAQNQGLRAQRPRQQSSNLPDSVSTNLLDYDSTITRGSAATWGFRPSERGRGDLIPPATKPENQDPNVPHAQVKSGIRTHMRLPDLQRYWSVIEGVYVCPGSKCNGRYRSRADFEAHLLSGAHVGGMVQCPNCLKRFKTTTALVAHAESGSTRCDLRHTEEFDLAMREITAGLIKVDGVYTNEGNARFESVPIDQW